MPKKLKHWFCCPAPGQKGTSIMSSKNKNPLTAVACNDKCMKVFQGDQKNNPGVLS